MSNPLWSLAVMSDTPWFSTTSCVCSNASRSAARNSGVPGLAAFSATGTAWPSNSPASYRCAPNVATLPAPFAASYRVT